MNSRIFIWVGVLSAVVVVMLLVRNSPPRSTDSPPLADDIGFGAVDQVQLSDAQTSFTLTSANSSAAPESLTDEEKFKMILALDDPAEQNRQLDELLEVWASRDPAKAGASVLTIEDEDLRKQSMLRVMQTWGSNDAPAALAWASEASFDNAYEREVAMSMACTELAKADAPEALRLALAYKFDESDRGLLEGLTTRWAETDLQAAQDWVLSIPASERRDSLIESIALVMFGQDPIASSQFVIEHVPLGTSLDKAVLSLVYRMADHDPAWTQKWVDTFPEGALRDRAAADLKAFQNRWRDAAVSF